MPEPVVYPVPWLEGTFTSRDRTEALLKPELENGTITYHDYESATSFYPGMHKYYPVRIHCMFH
ncbi:hypothetical protein EWM64_g4968 [Hericium alpestre]|uniref:Uncharacterized protein n=1 Tax=Hericium alpestre TaxID=135208 RepID=A0A4Y9ZVY6_9AGAM|nr:hypothetical protein EWM64_g4968 [Hericium alpestre]